MKYEVLARRYRPRRFEEVVGQESVAETLRGGIVQERVAHAYLFTGPRGVGKTSMARIFAKALNCQRAAGYSPSDADWAEKIAALPCNECLTCEGIHLGQDIDVVEMDGASHRGIDDVRSIVESVNRPATRSPYKIFIIDEVHMLTREAFNALLKTLEEPPGHVKFIFATTEPHRIPETVLSRCQRFDFHPINEEAIALRLGQILASEEREAEDGLLEKIARYGRGGLRDAQTLLDQALTFSEGKLRSEDLERITGRMPTELVVALSQAVVDGDDRAVLRGVRRCVEKGADPAVLIEQVIDQLRGQVERLVLEAPGRTPSSGARGEPSSEPSLAGPSLDRLLGILQILLEAASKLRHSVLPVVAVEVVLLKVARLEDPLVLEEVLRKLTALEERTRLDGEREGPSASGPSARPVSARRATSSTSTDRETSASPTAARAPAARSVPATDRPARPDRSGGNRALLKDAAPSPRGPAASSPPGSSDAAPSTSVSSTETATGGTKAESVNADRPPRGQAARSCEEVPEGGEPPGQGATDEAPERSSASPPAVGVGLSLERLLSLWSQIGIELQEKEPQIAPLIGDAEPELHPERRDTVRLFFEDDFYLARMKSPQNRRAFESLVADVTGQPWKFDLVRRTDGRRERGGKAGAGPGPAPPGHAVREGGADGADDRAQAGRVAGGSATSGGPSSLAANEVVEKARRLFNGRVM